MTQRAILCPRCRQLVGSEESVCSWCGTSRSAAWWHLINWTQGQGDGDWLVKGIITLNVLYFALSLMLGGGGGFISPGQTSLLLLGATGTIPIDYYGRIWTLLSANYLHSGILHIIFNLMALRQIAPLVAGEYGPSRLLIIYTLGGGLRIRCFLFRRGFVYDRRFGGRLQSDRRNALLWKEQGWRIRQHGIP